MGPFIRGLERRSPLIKGILTWGLVALIGMADYVTGPQVSSAVFYILPIAAAAWWHGRAGAYLLALAAALAWFAADNWDGTPYSHPAVGYWNGFSRLLLFVIVLELVRSLRRLLETTQRQADTDPLTGLLNRRAFELQAEREIARAQRFGHPFAAMFIDLDNFKQVNDRQGHAAGDAVLTRVAETMRSSLRHADTVARLGGDEFAVLLLEIAPAEAPSVAGDLRQRLLAAMEDMGSGVTFSIGVAVFLEPPADLAGVLTITDRLMYRAKYGGKNTIELATVNASQGRAAAPGTPA